MAQDDIIKDPHGNVLGRISASSFGRLLAYDPHGNTLGSYDPQSNRTYDPHGSLIGQGNMLSGLIMQAVK
jgi:YD repeat-containing protein